MAVNCWELKNKGEVLVEEGDFKQARKVFQMALDHADD